MGVYDQIVEELALHNPTVTVNPELGPGARVDARLETDDTTYLVDLRGQTATIEDLATLNLARDLLENTNQATTIRLILVAPRFSQETRALAQTTDIQLLQLPASQLPTDKTAGTTPLTTPKSWDVVATLLEHERFESLRALANSAHVSLGWASKVVQELEARGIAHRADTTIDLRDQQTLLDTIPQQRPFQDLLTLRIETGIDHVDNLAHSLQTHPQTDAPTLHVCGTTAATDYTGYIEQRDRFDIYTSHPHEIEATFEDATGGFTLYIFQPDRPLTQEPSFRDILPSVTPAQALLDTAGTGLAYRDLTRKLLEAMRS